MPVLCFQRLKRLFINCWLTTNLIFINVFISNWLICFSVLKSKLSFEEKLRLLTIFVLRESQQQICIYTMTCFFEFIFLHSRLFFQMVFYIMKYLHPKNQYNITGFQQLSSDLEGDFMLQNVTQVCEMNRSAGNPLRHGLSIMLNSFCKMEFNNPLYCFTLPGFILMTGGLHMSLNLALASIPGGGFDFESVAWVFLLTLIGIFMSFAGILLHSISGLMRYKKINRLSLRAR